MCLPRKKLFMQEAFGAGAAPTRTGDNQTRAPLLQRGGTIGEPKLAYISNLYPKFFGAEFVDPGQCALSRRQCSPSMVLLIRLKAEFCSVACQCRSAGQFERYLSVIRSASLNHEHAEQATLETQTPKPRQLSLSLSLSLCPDLGRSCHR